MNFYNYFFCKLYNIYINVLNEKQTPSFFSIGIISIFEIINLLFLDTISRNILNLNVFYIDFLGVYSVIILAFNTYYFYRKKRFAGMLKAYHKLESEKRKVNNIIIVIYVCVTILSIFSLD